MATTTLLVLAVALAAEAALAALFPADADALAEATAFLTAAAALEELDALELPLSLVETLVETGGVVAVTVVADCSSLLPPTAAAALELELDDALVPDEVEGPALALPEPEPAAAELPTAAALELEELEELPAKAEPVKIKLNKIANKMFFIEISFSRPFYILHRIYYIDLKFAMFLNVSTFKY